MSDLLFTRKVKKENKVSKPLTGKGVIELSTGEEVEFDVYIDDADAVKLQGHLAPLENGGGQTDALFDFLKNDYLKLPDEYDIKDQEAWDTMLTVSKMYSELNGIDASGQNLNREQRRNQRFQR